MAEYGLYGAMVRHSLPLPETIMRQQQNQLQQQSNRSSRNSSSDCENEEGATAAAAAAGSSSRETQDGPRTIPNSTATTESETQAGNESESDCSTAPWLLGMHKKSLEISGRLKSSNTSSSSSYQHLDNRGNLSTPIVPTKSSTSSRIAAEVNKKRELSSIFMSVKRILACGQPEESEQDDQMKLTNSGDKKGDISETSRQLEGEFGGSATTMLTCGQDHQRMDSASNKQLNKLISSRRQNQRSRSSVQQKRRLSKAAAQKLAQMRQQQLEESGGHFNNVVDQSHNHNLNNHHLQATRINDSVLDASGNNLDLINEPIHNNASSGNYGVEQLNGFISQVCQAQSAPNQVCNDQNNFFASGLRQATNNRVPVMNAANQSLGMFLPGQQQQQQNLLNSLHHLYYPPFTSAQQQHQQLSAPTNMFGLRPQQDPTELAQVGMFTKNSPDPLHQILSYHASNQAKRLQQSPFQALDSAGQHEQAQQLLMAAAAATVGQNQSQNSSLWLNEWMQRYMLSHSAAALAAQQQQQQLHPPARQLIPMTQQEHPRGFHEETTKSSRRNNFLNVANLIEGNIQDDEVDIDVVRPFVSSSLSLSQQTILNEDDCELEDSDESEECVGQELKQRKSLSISNGTPEVARNFHQVN